MSERENQSSAVARRPEPRRQVWDPWGEFSEVRQRFDDLFGRAFGGPMMSPLLSARERVFEPAVDLYETAEEFRLFAYLPGISRDRVNLDVEPDRLVLSGERVPPEVPQDAIAHLRGFGTGRFSWSTTLPCEVVPDKAEATYRDGVLEVRLAKAEQARWRKPVRVAVNG